MLNNREDMNKYNTASVNVPSQRTEGELSKTAGATAKTVGGMAWKAVKTILFIAMVTGLLVFISVASFILSFRDEEAPDLSAQKLNFSSFIYLGTESEGAQEYMTIYKNEDRVWATLDDEIPKHMQDAMVAIEDKRFWEHNGVDWKGTAGAVFKLFTHSGDGGGGSTLTQQLIKNLTGENQVSILRKVKEIFMALNMNKKYTREEILEAYLNVVNFGSQTQGVQAAAKRYFNKDISECDIAECAAIAGITQNPYYFDPLIFPDHNKERQQIVIEEMHDQKMITDAEYKEAMEKSENMVFVGNSDDETSDEDNQDEDKWNDYIDVVFEDVVNDLMEQKNYSRENAVKLIYNGGLQIYCAMDAKLQTDMENMFRNNAEVMPADTNIQAGMCMMDPYTGKLMSVVGSRDERVGVRLLNYATDTARQTGSSIKPLSVYGPAIALGEITYGSVLKDEPIPDYFPDGTAGPNNYSLEFEGTMNVDEALEISQNAPAARLCTQITPQASFDFLTNKLHFKNLVDADIDVSPMALGGMTHGATVREMTAGFSIYANGGYYKKPYTYYYVKDHDGNVLLDNRDVTGEQVMSTDQATVMNKLLHAPIDGTGTGRYPTGSMVQTDGVDIYGKTGTTDTTYDLWFIGATPLYVCGIWNGYEEPAELEDSDTCKVTWNAILDYMMANYNVSERSYVLSDNVVQLRFCRSSGLLAGGSCYDTAWGWYAQDDTLPRTCNGGSDHISGKKVSPSPSNGPTEAPSTPPTTPPSPPPSEPPVSSGLESSDPGTSSGVEPPPVSSEPPDDVTPGPEPPPGPDDNPTPPPDTSSSPPPVTSGDGVVSQWWENQ